MIQSKGIDYIALHSSSAKIGERVRVLLHCKIGDKNQLKSTPARYSFWSEYCSCIESKIQSIYSYTEYYSGSKFQTLKLQNSLELHVIMRITKLKFWAIISRILTGLTKLDSVLKRECWHICSKY
jgi:hypothetical protein